MKIRKESQCIGGFPVLHVELHCQEQHQRIAYHQGNASFQVVIVELADQCFGAFVVAVVHHFKADQAVAIANIHICLIP